MSMDSDLTYSESEGGDVSDRTKTYIADQRIKEEIYGSDKK